MEMKSKVVQFYIDVGTWNMMAILGLRRIQVNGEIVRILTLIRHGVDENFTDQEWTGVHSWCIN